MQRKQVITGFAVAGALMLTGTACASSGGSGGSGKGPDGGASSSDAAAAGARAQSLTLLAKMTAPQAVAQTSKAVSSKKSAKMHMTLTSPALNETADGAVAFGAPPKMDMTMSMSSTNAQLAPVYSQLGKMEVRLIGPVGYVDMSHSPQIAAALQGKKWLKLDFAKVEQIPELKSFAFMKDMLKDNDPSTKLDSLQAAPDLKLVGTEQHNGVQALHYSGTVAPEDVVKATGTGLTQADLDSMRATMQQAGVTKVSYELWVDGTGLPVEIKFSEDSNAGTISGDITYSDWGAPLSVTAPPADQTADIVDMIKQQ